MKRWSEVSPYSGLEEDVPTNNASSGDVAMPPDAVKKKKKLIDRSMVDARTKSYREHRARLETRRVKREERKNKSKFIEKVKEEVASEMAYGSGYDTVKPVADIQPVNAAKSSSGYELYHKQFSGAMQHAYKFAKSKGVTVDPAEIDSKVASGPRKPSSGKTNSYILGTNKKNKQVHIQVANLDNKRYELNMYID
jgi:FtsZ-interacting cell division protein YlmF